MLIFAKNYPHIFTKFIFVSWKSHTFQLSNVKVIYNTFKLVTNIIVWFSEPKMNPLLFWMVVYLIRENFNRLTIAVEVFTSSIDRLERRLERRIINMQNDITILRHLDQTEDMDVDDWNHSLFILVAYICHNIEKSNVKKSWKYFSCWFSRMVVYFFKIYTITMKLFIAFQIRFFFYKHKILFISSNMIQIAAIN